MLLIENPSDIASGEREKTVNIHQNINKRTFFI